MQVSVEKISPNERRLTIVVPADQLKDAYTKHLSQFKQKANIKGFRPGKAPESYIEQRFGNDARQEALSEVIQKNLYQAITEQQLQPVSTPKIEPKTITLDQPLEFIASFEVLPEIENVQFSLGSIEKPVAEVADDDLEKVVGQLQKQYTKWQAVERGATEKDRIIIDYYAIFDGQSDEDNKVQNFPLELGGNVMLPGFEAGLMGAKAGEERTLSLTFPSDFNIAEKAGKPVDFVVQIKQVVQGETPAVDAEFAKRLGIKDGDITELKRQIKQSLEQERDRLVNEKLKEQVFRHLLEQNPIAVPASMIEREAQNIHNEIHPHHHDHHAHSDEEMAAFNEMAKKRVTLGILLSEYAKQADVKVDKERVQKRIIEIAAAYENPKEVITWLSEKERINGIEMQVLEDQVMEKLMTMVPVTEKVMTYAELKNIRI